MLAGESSKRLKEQSENQTVSLRLVTADMPAEAYTDEDRGPATGIIIGVFCGAMFWSGLIIGWMAWG